MSPKDRELMEKIFNDVEASDPLEQEAAEMASIEVERLNFAMHMFVSFDEQIEKRILRGIADPFFLAPPHNFSYAVN